MKRVRSLLAACALVAALAPAALAIPVEDPTAWALLQQQLVQWATQIGEAVLTNEQLQIYERWRVQVTGRYAAVWTRLPEAVQRVVVNVPVDLKNLGWPAQSKFEQLPTTVAALTAMDEYKRTVQSRNTANVTADGRAVAARARRNLEVIFGEVAVSPKGVVQENIYREAAMLMDQIGKSSEAIEENKANLAGIAAAFESGTLVPGDRERKGKELDIQQARAGLINADVNRLVARALVQSMLTQGHHIGEIERARFRGIEMNQAGLAGVNYSLRKTAYTGVD